MNVLACIGLCYIDTPWYSSCPNNTAICRNAWIAKTFFNRLLMTMFLVGRDDSSIFSTTQFLKETKNISFLFSWVGTCLPNFHKMIGNYARGHQLRKTEQRINQIKLFWENYTTRCFIGFGWLLIFATDPYIHVDFLEEVKLMKKKNYVQINGNMLYPRHVDACRLWIIL